MPLWLIIVVAVVLVMVVILTSSKGQLGGGGGGGGNGTLQWAEYYNRTTGSSFEKFLSAWNSCGLSARFRAVDVSVLAVMAISVHETGWGASRAALNGNNLWGVSDWNEEKGMMWPRYYPNVLDSLTNFFAVIKQSRYAEAWAVRADAEEFVQRLSRCGYNESQEWRDGVSQIIAQLRSKGVQ